MSDAAEKLKAAVLELPLPERLALADFIYSTLPRVPGIMTEGDPGFDEELDRRLREHESGRDQWIPAEEFFRRLREERVSTRSS